MSCEHKRKTSLLLFVLLFVAVCAFHAGDSIKVPRGKVSYLNGWQSKHNPENTDSERVIRVAPLHKSDHIRLRFPQDIEDKVKEIVKSLEQDVMYSPQAWTVGNVSRSTHSHRHMDAGYQADTAGGVQSVKAGTPGTVLGPSFDSSTFVPEWLAMRPLVQCHDDIMTLTATGRGYTHLLVRREDSTPISPFQLPPHCGYSVSTSWKDLVMTAPYDGCYITQENGSYVLPMLWWGAPLKLSCPAPPPSSAPGVVVLCSCYGMVVHLYNGEEGICSAAWAMVSGEWDTFASKLCAHPIDVRPGQCLFFIPLGAPCVTVGDGVHLKLLLNKQQFILSCPVNPHLFPYFPSPPYSQPSFPGDPQYPYSPGPGTTEAPSKPPPPPQPPTQLSQGPPGPWLAHLPRPSTGSPPGGVQSSQSPHLIRPGQLPYSPEIDPKPPSQPSIPDYPASTKATQPSKLPMVPQNYPNPQHYPSPTRKPNVQGPPTSAPQFPKQPSGPQYPPQYPPLYPHYNPFYPMYYPQPQMPPTAPAAPPPQPPTQLSQGPPGPWLVHLPQPSPGGPPGGVQSSQSPHLIRPGQLPYSPEIDPNPPSQPSIPDYPASTKATQPSKLPMVPQNYPNPQHHASPTRKPHVQGPHTSAPQFPKQPLGPQYPPLYPPYYNPFNPMYYPQPQVPPTAPPAPVSIPKTIVPEEPHVPRYSPGQYYPPISFDHNYYPYGYGPIYVPMPPPAKGPPHDSPAQPSGPVDTAVSVVQPTQPHGRPMCPPNAHAFCSYYPYHAFYPPQYPVPLHPYAPTTPETESLTPHPPSPDTEYTATPDSEGFPTPGTDFFFPPVTESPTTPEISPYFPPATVTQPPQLPQLQCVAGRMTLALPSSVDLDSISVREVKSGFNVPESCKYMLEYKQGHGVTLHSPHPSCPVPQHTTTVLLGFRENKTYRSLKVECPFHLPTSQGPTEPPVTSKPSTPSIIPRPEVYCSAHRMTVELPRGLIAGIVVKDANGNQMKLRNAQDAPEHCGYFASKGKDGRIILKLPLNSDCHMSVQGKEHLINIVYYTTMHERREAQLSCPVSIPVSHTECDLPSDQRLPCGSNSSSQQQCLSVGCCFSTSPPACYYPMDECTMDRHFVFSVPSSLNERLMSRSMVAANNSSCTPQKVTRDYALFKIPMDSCGAVRLEVGKTVIYMVEITNVIQSISLNYGTITRDAPVRLLVECRYLPGSVVSVGYMVKSPTLGSPIHSQGIFGVQLRISKDPDYKSYYPDVHRPLRKLLREPLHLELRVLNSPDPDLVLLVHYCVAYPRSGHSAWVILYNGCPNPLDPAPQQAVLPPPSPPSPQKQIRRFTISTFKFLNHGKTAGGKTAGRKGAGRKGAGRKAAGRETDGGETAGSETAGRKAAGSETAGRKTAGRETAGVKTDDDKTAEEEEIYFMCSTEVCSPLDGPCVEGCFGQ